MNVNNFFRFIGEKKPEYKLSSDNKDLIQTFKNGFEKNVDYGQEYDDEECRFPPMEIDGKSHTDANGKQGLFLTIIGYSEREPGYGDEPHGYSFSYAKTYTEYKDDLINKQSYIRDNGSVAWVKEFNKGVQDGLEIHYGMLKGNVVSKTYYENGRKKRKDFYYKDTQTPAFTTYYKEHHNIDGSTKQKYIIDVEDRDRPVQYYSPDGEKITYKTYYDNRYFMNIDILGLGY